VTIFELAPSLHFDATQVISFTRAYVCSGTKPKERQRQLIVPLRQPFLLIVNGDVMAAAGPVVRQMGGQLNTGFAGRQLDFATAPKEPLVHRSKQTNQAFLEKWTQKQQPSTPPTESFECAGALAPRLE